MSNNISLIFVIATLAGLAYVLTTAWGQDKWTVLSTWVLSTKDNSPKQNASTPKFNPIINPQSYIKVRGTNVTLPLIFTQG